MPEKMVEEYHPDSEPIQYGPDDEMQCDRCLRDRKRRQVKRVTGTPHKGGTFSIWVCKVGCEFVRGNIAARYARPDEGTDHE